jgi:cytochrome oxidase Cu insertion factor (SCO1/SenC/PrrC family)
VRLLYAGFLGLAALGLAGCSSTMSQPPSTRAELAVDYPVADFSLMERSGRTIKREDLLGKVWIASFVFTRCTGPCPVVSAAMARLQDELKLKDEPHLRLVTFSVDPEHDKPDVLKRYAATYGADPERWLFLTGDEKVIHDLSLHSFMQGVGKNPGTAPSPGTAVTHTTRLALVDRRGHVRYIYDGEAIDEELPRLRQRVAELLREKP